MLDDVVMVSGKYDKNVKIILNQLDVTVMGQVITGRVETIEDYLKDRAHLLMFIGLPGLFQPTNESRGTLYSHGKVLMNFPLFYFNTEKASSSDRPSIFIKIIIQFLNGFLAFFRFKSRSHIFIGIGALPGLMGLLLKKIGLIKHNIFYSIDKPFPISLSAKLYRNLNDYLAKHSDIIWNISMNMMTQNSNEKSLLVPLGYSSKKMMTNSINEIEEKTIVFVGTLSENQGVQLLIEAMPNILKRIPDIKVRIIGSGPYESCLKEQIVNANLSDHFIFHGFVKNEDDMMRIVSKSAIGIAPYMSTYGDNAVTTDSGKPKLYLFCGVPVIITNGPSIAAEIDRNKAGKIIRYNLDDLVEAVIFLLDETKLPVYKNNAFRLAKRYTSEQIFDRTFTASIKILHKII